MLALYWHSKQRQNERGANVCVQLTPAGLGKAKTHMENRSSNYDSQIVDLEKLAQKLTRDDLDRKAELKLILTISESKRRRKALVQFVHT